MPLYSAPVTPFDETIISTTDPLHSNILGLQNAAGLSLNLAAWPAANLAIFVPIHIWKTLTITSFLIQQGTTSGSVDVGLYNTSFAKIVSSGSTTSSGLVQQLDVADTTIVRGQYFLALAYNNATAQIRRSALPSTWIGRMIGMLEQSSAFPLPETATPVPVTAAGTNLRYPYIAFTTSTYGL